MDPAVRISVFQEFSPAEGFSGVTQVQGFHDDTRAFLFQGKAIKTANKLKMDSILSTDNARFPKCGCNMFFLGFALLCIKNHHMLSWVFIDMYTCMHAWFFLNALG